MGCGEISGPDILEWEVDLLKVGCGTQTRILVFKISASEWRRKHFCPAPLWKNRPPSATHNSNKSSGGCGSVGFHATSVSNQWTLRDGFRSFFHSSFLTIGWLDHSWRVNAVLSIWRIISVHCHIALTPRGSWFMISRGKESLSRPTNPLLNLKYLNNDNRGWMKSFPHLGYQSRKCPRPFPTTLYSKRCLKVGKLAVHLDLF